MFLHYGFFNFKNMRKTNVQIKQDVFDQYASEYDAWFMRNQNLLHSEVALVAYFLKDTGRTISIGCGSGLFEHILKKNYDIRIEYGLEPSASMAEIAEKRGMKVQVGSVQTSDIGKESYDTVLFNGSPSYISDLKLAFRKAFNALVRGGKIVVIDVPKEGSFAILYNLAKTLETWDDLLFEGVKPREVYPIEFVKEARWRTTPEKIALLEETGFHDFQFAQTLTKHPVYADKEVEIPREGYNQGDYVAICGIK